MSYNFSTLDQLRKVLDDRAEGVLTANMWEIRDAYGADRLGVNVVANISSALDNLGIAHFPAELPRDQWALVRVYLRASPVGEVIEAALNPDEKRDAILRKLTSEKADHILRKVRELVCD